MSALGHYDPPSPPAIEDFVTIKELTAKTDQDDGINGESEYIVRITFKHPGHSEADSEILLEFNVNWDDIDPDTGLPYDSQVPLHLPLIGKNGFGSDKINSRIHQECSPSAPWEITLDVKESNDQSLGDILKTLGDAAAKAGTNLPPVDAKVKGIVIIGGILSGAVGDILNKLFNNMENLGFTNPNFNGGDGDPGDTNKVRSDSLAHFSYTAEKSVKVIPGKIHECESTNTNTPTESPEHTFGDDAQKAQASWDYLLTATGMIDTTSIEPGTPDGDAEQAALHERRQALRELVAAMGRDVAQVEIDEAEDHPELVSSTQLDIALQQMAMGDSYKQQSLSQSNTSPMFQALQLYRQVFTSLAHNLHETQTSALDAYQSGSDIVINWQHGGVLQSSASLDGGWQDIPAAISGYRTAIGVGNRFFRVIKR